MAFPSERSSRNGGFLEGNRESGERSLSGHQTGYRLEQEQLQCQSQTSPAEEERDVALCNRAAGIAITRGA
jgi:hypothetical protein